MVAPITTGNFPKNLQPGVMAWIEMGYKKNPEICPKLFQVKNTKKKYEEAVAASSFPVAVNRAEGSPTAIASERQGYIVRTQMLNVALGYAVTDEAVMYGVDKEIASKRAMRLGDSFRETKEILGHKIFNDAFTNTRVGGDGVAMISDEHGVAVGGKQSNLISTGNADLSHGSLSDLLKDIRRAKDTNGKFIALKPKTLLIHPNNEHEAYTILNSTNRSGTADNDVNSIKGLYNLDVVVSPYLADEDAFFVLNEMNMHEGLVHFKVSGLKMADPDYEPSTHTTYYYGSEYYAFNYHDWRAGYGSAGA